VPKAYGKWFKNGENRKEKKGENRDVSAKLGNGGGEPVHDDTICDLRRLSSQRRVSDGQHFTGVTQGNQCKGWLRLKKWLKVRQEARAKSEGKETIKKRQIDREKKRH